MTISNCTHDINIVGAQSCFGALESTKLIFKKVILIMATNHYPDENGPIPNVNPILKRFKMK